MVVLALGVASAPLAAVCTWASEGVPCFLERAGPEALHVRGPLSRSQAACFGIEWKGYALIWAHSALCFGHRPAETGETLLVN